MHSGSIIYQSNWWISHLHQTRRGRRGPQEARTAAFVGDAVQDPEPSDLPCSRRKIVMNEPVRAINKMMYTAYFDGSCWPVNPGGIASYGAIVFADGKRIWECSEIYSPPAGHEKDTSNNVAECRGLIALLDYFMTNGLTGEQIVIHGDSLYVIRRCFQPGKSPKGLYAPHVHEARAKLLQFTHIVGQWIPRELNEFADKLSKSVIPKQSLNKLGQLAAPSAPGYDNHATGMSSMKGGPQFIVDNPSLVAIPTPKQKAVEFLAWRSKRQEEEQAGS